MKYRALVKGTSTGPKAREASSSGKVIGAMNSSLIAKGEVVSGLHIRSLHLPCPTRACVHICKRLLVSCYEHQNVPVTDANTTPSVWSPVPAALGLRVFTFILAFFAPALSLSLELAFFNSTPLALIHRLQVKTNVMLSNPFKPTFHTAYQASPLVKCTPCSAK